MVAVPLGRLVSLVVVALRRVDVHLLAEVGDDHRGKAHVEALLVVLLYVTALQLHQVFDPAASLLIQCGQFGFYLFF